MKVEVRTSRINSVLTVIIGTSHWDRFELDAMVRAGEPSVDIGGVFVKDMPGCDGRGPVTRATYVERMRAFLDELSRHEPDGLVSGNAIRSLLIDLADAASPDGSEPADSTDSTDDCPACRFELPEERRKIRSGFPVMAEFSDDDFDDADICAKSWAAEIVKRLANVVRNLRSDVDPVVRKETYEL